MGEGWGEGVAGVQPASVGGKQAPPREAKRPARILPINQPLITNKTSPCSHT